MTPRKASFRLASEAGLIEKDLAARLAPSTGMRNVLIHAYMDLDIDKFVDAIPMALEQYAVRRAGGALAAGPSEGVRGDIGVLRPRLGGHRIRLTAVSAVRVATIDAALRRAALFLDGSA